MTGRRNSARARAGAHAALLAIALLLAVAPARASTGETAGIPPEESAGTLELVRQTAVVEQGGAFNLWLAPDGLAADGSVEVVVHGRVRSRSELATSIDGVGLRAAIYQVVKPVSELAPAADGSRRLSLSLDQTTPGGINLGSAGVYPVELIGRDLDGNPTTTLTTHLVLAPVATDESPPLAVAVVAELGEGSAFTAAGDIDIDDRDVTSLTALLDGLAAHPDTATIAPHPDLVAALVSSPEPDHATLLDLLRTTAAAHRVLAMPFAATSPDALLAAGLGGELVHQLDVGRRIVADALDVQPDPSAWLAGEDLTIAGVTALDDLGVRHIVVGSAQVEPLRPGLVTLSLAQPFRLSAPDERAVSGVDGFAIDDGVAARFDGQGSPGLEVSRILAELAMLWFERPGVERAAVIPIDDTVRGEVVAGLLDGLRGGSVFEAVPLDDAFERPRHLQQPGGSEVERELTPGRGTRVDAAVADGLPSTRRLLESFTTLLDEDSTVRPSAVQAHLLLATSTAVRHQTQREHLAQARSLMDDIIAGVSAPERETVTLTARSGTVPLTLRNDTGEPIHVVVRLRSTKLEFPDGDEVPLVLSGERTRVDIAVRTRASGSFPLDVEVTSPDGAISLAAIDYSIQSTAVSGVGVVLSAGAALFLLVWWGRHWSRTRRSAKLVEARHLRVEPTADHSEPQ